MKKELILKIAYVDGVKIYEFTGANDDFNLTYEYTDKTWKTYNGAANWAKKHGYEIADVWADRF